MYKVFVNDIPIILSTKKELNSRYISFPLKEAKIKRIIKKIYKGKLQYVNLYHEKEEKLLKHLFKKLPVVTAGGGLVYNDKGEVLFIHRNGLWDLPKGKIEKDESIETGAVREVEEETGVKNLKIEKFLQTTYHIFKRRGRYRLKVTYWYKMTTAYNGELVPETNEGIHKVKWKNPIKVQKALKNSYANIQLLFSDVTSPTHSKDGVS